MQTTKNLGAAAVTHHAPTNHSANYSRIENLLHHLDKIKKTGQGKWMACCPAHADKTASLSIRELDDGRVLVHCFAACSVEEVLSAVGLTFDALYPPREIEHGRFERRPFPAADILRAIAHEAVIVYLSAQAVAKGQVLPESDIQRLLVAASRIQAALTAGGISHA